MSNLPAQLVPLIICAFAFRLFAPDSNLLIVHSTTHLRIYGTVCQ